MDDRNRSLEGGCLCGAVRFTARGRFGEVSVCHCSQCRRWHGAPGPYTSVRRDRLNFHNQRGLAWYRSSERARRGFCRECGASLFWDMPDQTYTAIAMGAFDGPTGLAQTVHIFVADKGDSYQITDGLPQWPASHHGG